MQWLDAARARLRLLFSWRTADSRMQVEFDLHIDLEAERLMRDGLPADEARRRARAAFGGVQQHKESLRDGRGLAWLGGLVLDLKLGTRMLARYPALTLVGGAAMAFGIAVGVVGFEIRTQFIDPSIPLDEGSRIVGLRIWNASLNRTTPSTAGDVESWRDRLTRVEDVSAYRTFSRNLITSDGRSEPEAVAAMSASAFRVARVAPLFGRTLIDADDRPGAPPVIVIGHEVWKRRFSANPAVLGQLVRLGSEQTTVVGVMPEGFTFPTAHGLWIPLQPETRTGSDFRSEIRPGPNYELLVFGRLADDASRAQAQAELSAIGLPAVDGSRGTREHGLPQLVPYSWLEFDPQGLQIALTLGNTFAVLLLVLVSANVALLMFARAASRETEIAVRSALGAGRARIVVQLFIEALVLAGVAVAVGLAASRMGLDSLLASRAIESGPLPFWVTADLTPSTMIYAAALTMISAAIIGILPALIATGRGHEARLRQASARSGGVRFGGVWTVVIAAQVAATVVFPAAAFVFHRAVIAGETQDVGFPVNRYLSARLDLEAGSRRTTFAELERQMSAEPAVTGLTFADRLPGTLHPLWRIESEGGSPASAPGRHQAVSASVAPNFFDVLGVPVIAGRAFTAADIDSSFGVVIVNQSFVTTVFGGRNPIGQRIRRQPRNTAQQPGPWLEIVGVVKDLGMNGNTNGAGFYDPVQPDETATLRAVIGVNGRPESFGARFRTVAGEVEPTLQIHELMSLDDVGASQWNDSQYLSRVLAVLSASALLLSLTAIYAVTAFTVTKRTREIGIRVALGADRHRVVGLLIRRPLFQVALGIAAGSALVALLVTGLFEQPPSAGQLGLIGAYALAMMGICLVACLVPAGRALRAEPAEVLSIEA